MEGLFAPEVMPPFMRGEEIGKVSWFYALLARIFGIIIPMVYRVTILGYENTPKDSGYIIAPNHDNETDPFPMSWFHYYWGEPIYWLAKIEIFRGGRFRSGPFTLVVPEGMATWLTYSVLCIPVTRPVNPGDLPERETIRAIGKILKGGGVVGIFPEGTRHRHRTSSEELTLHAGSIKFAQSAHVPVVPVLIKSTRPSLGHRGEYVLKYGQPFYPIKGQTTEEQLAVLRQSMEDLGCFQ